MPCVCRFPLGWTSALPSTLLRCWNSVKVNVFVAQQITVFTHQCTWIAQYLFEYAVLIIELMFWLNFAAIFIRFSFCVHVEVRNSNLKTCMTSSTEHQERQATTSNVLLMPCGHKNLGIYQPVGIKSRILLSDCKLRHRGFTALSLLCLKLSWHWVVTSCRWMMRDSRRQCRMLALLCISMQWLRTDRNVTVNEILLCLYCI